MSDWLLRVSTQRGPTRRQGGGIRSGPHLYFLWIAWRDVRSPISARPTEREYRAGQFSAIRRYHSGLAGEDPFGAVAGANRLRVNPATVLARHVIGHFNPELHAAHLTILAVLLPRGAVAEQVLEGRRQGLTHGN